MKNAHFLSLIPWDVRIVLKSWRPYFKNGWIQVRAVPITIGLPGAGTHKSVLEEVTNDDHVVSTSANITWSWIHPLQLNVVRIALPAHAAAFGLNILNLCQFIWSDGWTRLAQALGKLSLMSLYIWSASDGRLPPPGYLNVSLQNQIGSNSRVIFHL